MSKLLVTVLTDNTVKVGGTLAEHGLSLWVETPDARMLFDTGQGLSLQHNAEAMDIDLGRTDAIVLSHGHYDHSGGLSYAFIQAPEAPMYLHPSALLVRFSHHGGNTREIGMPAQVRDIVEQRRRMVTWTTKPTMVRPGVCLTGPIPRPNGTEDSVARFSLDAKGEAPDLIDDDQAMWIETDAGLVVLLGCAHAGVGNTLDYIGTLTGGKRIHAIIGGLHLDSAPPESLIPIVASLQRRDVGGWWPCHCTGASATAHMMAAFEQNCHSCGVGTRVEL